ncbi:sensor histidine kinase [Gracilibacillus timonensis]|uniref:sensor histidine kinase n=1 Tax=Gracilibacillus timonensis TaxID=1816696 RepID=UPI000825B1B5|nr:ATP-binding protein [Gracilibacillus timonensis]
MDRIKKYQVIKAIFYFIHIYLMFELLSQYGSLLDELYLPLVFSTIIALMTYIINTQVNSKSSNFLIYFLLAGSIAYTSSLGRSVGVSETVLPFVITFQLCGWYFQKFMHEILANHRLVRRNHPKKYDIRLILLALISGFYVFAHFSNTLYAVARVVFILYFFINIGTPLVKVIYLLLHKNQPKRSLLSWMLGVPVAAFFPFFLLHVIPSLFGQPWVNAYLTAWAFFIIPIGYTYLILAKKMISIRLVMNRVIYYSGLALLQSLFLLFFLFWFHVDLNLMDTLQVFLPLLLLNILFFFIKEQFDYRLRNLLFRDRNNRVQSIEKLVNELEHCLTKEEVDNVAIREINRKFERVDVTVLTYHEQTDQLEREYLIGEADFAEVPFSQLANQGSPIMIEHENRMGICLAKQSNTWDYLWIRKQQGKARFQQEDKDWLVQLVSYLRFAYEIIRSNQRSVRQLMEEGDTSPEASRFLFHFGEIERRRLAEDIHDTILQDQIYVSRELERLAEEKNQPELQKLRNKVKQIIDKTRETCEDMMPATLSQQGLAASLEKLGVQFQQTTAFQFRYDVEIEAEPFEHHQKSRVIYRLVEELLNNAMQHADAKHVTVHVWQTAADVYLDYLDDGKGFDDKEALQEGGTGLNSFVNRVESVDGSMELKTDTRRAVQILITIPR